MAYWRGMKHKCPSPLKNCVFTLVDEFCIYICLDSNGDAALNPLEILFRNPIKKCHLNIQYNVNHLQFQN
jgi:hypothetical protein